MPSPKRVRTATITIVETEGEEAVDLKVDFNPPIKSSDDATISTFIATRAVMFIEDWLAGDWESDPVLNDA